jgi:hypothetical protein
MRAMRIRWSLGLVAIVLVVVVSDVRAAETSRPMPSPSAPGDATTRWSEHQRFRVHYDSRPSPVPLLTVHQWTVTSATPRHVP